MARFRLGNESRESSIGKRRRRRSTDYVKDIGKHKIMYERIVGRNWMEREERGMAGEYGLRTGRERMVDERNRE